MSFDPLPPFINDRFPASKPFLAKQTANGVLRSATGGSSDGMPSDYKPYREEHGDRYVCSRSDPTLTAAGYEEVIFTDATTTCVWRVEGPCI